MQKGRMSLRRRNPARGAIAAAAAAIPSVPQSSLEAAIAAPSAPLLTVVSVPAAPKPELKEVGVRGGQRPTDAETIRNVEPTPRGVTPEARHERVRIEAYLRAERSG